MREYRCRRCGWWVISSDATYGKVRAACTNGRCRTVQLILLGGRQGRPEDPSDQEADSPEPSRQERPPGLSSNGLTPSGMLS